MYARLHWILVTSLISYRILSSAESILNGYWKKKPTTTTAHYRSVLVVDCLWNGNKLLFTRTDFSFFQKNRGNLKYVYICYNNYYYQFWQYKLLLKIITCSYQAECGSWPTGLQTKDIQMWFKNVKLTWLLATSIELFLLSWKWSCLIVISSLLPTLVHSLRKISFWHFEQKYKRNWY